MSWAGTTAALGQGVLNRLTFRSLAYPGLVAGLICVGACEENPTGAEGAVFLRRVSGPQDSVLAGAPGRALPAPVALQVLDGDGNPIVRAAVRWTVVGGNGRVEHAPELSDEQGRIEADWVLGTVASDSQRLTIEVQAGRREAATTIAAVATPDVVSAMAFKAETSTVKLGVPTIVAIDATDPFGNHFAPRNVKFASLDTTLAIVDSTGTVAVRKRGYVRFVATSGALTDTAWVHGTQIVQSIAGGQDTLRFRSIGQDLALGVKLVDDGGRPVLDSVPGVTASDTTIVTLRAGDTLKVRSLANGTTAVRVQAGAASRELTALVRQRVASAAFALPALSFDALTDTARSSLALHDSLGAPIERAQITFSSSDSSVASVDTAGLVTARGNGNATVTGTSRSGVAASLRVAVQQRVASVILSADSLTFDALRAALPLRATLRDRLGSVVTGATATFMTADPAVATVDASGSVHAVGNGMTVLRAVNGADTASALIRVAQRPVQVVVPQDTVKFVAVGDSERLTGVAVDSLGSPVGGGVTGVAVADTAVSGVRDSTLHARANGITSATLTVAGITHQIVVVVNQVPTTLNVAVAFGNPVVTLPAGAAFPLACEARDKNGFVIPSEPALVRSVHGTVAGAGCSGARVVQSGYDTLVFAMGSVQARVPVIVATRPDSVGIVAAAQPLTTVARDLYVGEDLSNPLILALRPLVAEILAAYGNPTSNLDKARALRDWLARTAVHPHPPLHPDGSTANLGVLPPGKTWADVNALIFAPSKDSLLAANVAYWSSIGFDGYAMLDRLLGTLDPATGLRADDGMMVRVGGARYQIRDLTTYKYPICTYQAIMLSALWEAAGLQGMLISTLEHDPAAVFIPEVGRWIYEDPTFNEEYLLDGTGYPLAPADLLALTTAGEGGRLRATKYQGPSFDPQVYIPTVSYVGQHPEGIIIMGSQLNNRVVGIGGWPVKLVQIDVPRLAEESPFNNPLAYDPVQGPVAFPLLGVVVEQVHVQDSVYLAQLATTLPNSDHLERRVNGGTWTRVPALDVLPVGECRVEYRSVDARGNVSASTLLDLWVPRGDGFLAAGVQGSVRTQTQLSVATF